MRKFSKHDVFLLLFIAIFACVSMGFWFYQTFQSFDQVVIEVNGSLYGTYDISEDQTIEIVADGEVCNTILIEDETVTMITSTCPDHLCEHQGTISKNGQQIVCLPNKVVVQLKGQEETEYDSIAQ